MEKALKKMFKKGYKVNLASSSSERGSSLLKELGYQSVIEGIKTDDVIKDIFSDLNNEDAIDLVFGDGNFANIPLGSFRTYYRTSANTKYVIQPADMQNIQSAIWENFTKGCCHAIG